MSYVKRFLVFLYYCLKFKIIKTVLGITALYSLKIIWNLHENIMYYSILCNYEGVINSVHNYTHTQCVCMSVCACVCLCVCVWGYNIYFISFDYNQRFYTMYWISSTESTMLNYCYQWSTDIRQYPFPCCSLTSYFYSPIYSLIFLYSYLILYSSILL